MIMIDADTLKQMIAAEIQALTDPRIIDNITPRLCEPRAELFDWSYGPVAQYSCWIVLEDDPSHTTTGIVYCAEGFGPRCPWGLVDLEPRDEYRLMGQDCSWFTSFLDAYWDSFVPTVLPIWRVTKSETYDFLNVSMTDDEVWARLKEIENRRETLSDEIPWEEAWKLQKEMQSRDPSARYEVKYLPPINQLP